MKRRKIKKVNFFLKQDGSRNKCGIKPHSDNDEHIQVDPHLVGIQSAIQCVPNVMVTIIIGISEITIVKKFQIFQRYLNTRLKYTETPCTATLQHIKFGINLKHEFFSCKLFTIKYENHSVFWKVTYLLYSRFKIVESDSFTVDFV